MKAHQGEKGKAEDDVDGVKVDLKICNLSKDIAQARSKWRNKIHAADPTRIGQGFDDDDDDIKSMHNWNQRLGNQASNP